MAHSLHRFIYRTAIFSLGLILLVLPGIVQAQSTDLPPSAWYAVAWDRTIDTLYWGSKNGEVASIPRPKLPAEAIDATPEMRIAPDGRALLIVSTLANGQNGLGIYDLAAGQFRQTHAAQPGERVHLGIGPSSFEDHVVVGFSTPSSGAWRLIVFEWSTGNAEFLLSHDDPIAAQVTESRRVPQVVYYGFDSAARAEAVQFQLAPDGQSRVGDVLAWYPVDGSLAPGLYAETSGDIRPSTGERVFAYDDARFPTLPQNEEFADGRNAIGRGRALNPRLVYADNATYKSSPRWVAGGRLVAFQADGATQSGWQVVQANADGTRAPTLLPADVSAVYGTPDGMLMVQSGRFIHIEDVDGSTAVTVFDGESSSLSVIYVTPETIPFRLTSIAAPEPPTTPTPTATEAVTCAVGPEIRMIVGQGGEVTGTFPLRIRSAPNGEPLAEMPLGSVFDVIGGPSCGNRFVWWNVRWIDEAGTVIEGWSAEGATDEYYMQPRFNPPTPTPAQTATPTTQPLSVRPFAPPTITPSDDDG